MNGQWTEIELQGPPPLTAWTWGGLMIVEAFDDCVWPDNFEIWHEASRERILHVYGSLERAKDIALALAGVADWSAMSTTDDLMIQARVMAFGADYPKEVIVENEWSDWDWDGIVPYGEPATRSLQSRSIR